MMAQQCPATGTALAIYEEKIAPARETFRHHSTLVTRLLNSDIPPTVLELFLIHFNGIGVSMTRPVEGWIRRAGVKCIAMGLLDLGKALLTHARQEAGHDRMMDADTRHLVSRWNSKHALQLDPDRIIANSSTTGTRLYFELHEEIIASDRPYRQLAIEFEIEQLSHNYGASLLQLCARLLGSEILAGLSFTQEHVIADVGHTKFNSHQMDLLLTRKPEIVDEMVSTGHAALTAYDQFLADCLDAACACLAHTGH